MNFDFEEFYGLKRNRKESDYIDIEATRNAINELTIAFSTIIKDDKFIVCAMTKKIYLRMVF